MRPAWSGLRHTLKGGRRRRTREIVCGRAFCPRCGRWRLLCDFAPDGKKGGKPRSWCRVCQRESNRASRARWSEKQKELFREYQRFWTEAKRREQGVPVRNLRYREVVDARVDRVLLEREPLLQLMRDSGIPRELIAEQAGVSDRTLTRIVSGESQHVRRDVADKVTTALGMPLSVVYPEWLEAA